MMTISGIVFVFGIVAILGIVFIFIIVYFSLTQSKITKQNFKWLCNKEISHFISKV